MSLTRFQHGVALRPTAAASCCTVWRESRCSSASRARSLSSRTYIAVFADSQKPILQSAADSAETEAYSRGAQLNCPFRSSPEGRPMPASLVRPDYALADNLGASAGTVFLTGTQALIRLALMQSARDKAAGIGSSGFISGYRGSP